SYALAAVDLGTSGLMASVILFGIGGWSVPAIMGAAVGDYAGPRNAVSILGLITVAFALGQTVGPALAGLLAEATESFIACYVAIAVAAAIAVVISLTLPPPRDAAPAGD
ncbi:MAG: MFS transporter, partial [Rhodospirillaceae bacterium]